MFIASPDHDSDPALAQLKEFSDRISQKKQGGRSLKIQGEAFHLSAANWSDHNGSGQNAEKPSVALHAAPLMPLRQRDMQVMAEIFEQASLEAMDAIEADVLAHLAKLSPEPCWEDEPFDFLQDYL